MKLQQPQSDPIDNFLEEGLSYQEKLLNRGVALFQHQTGRPPTEEDLPRIIEMMTGSVRNELDPVAQKIFDTMGVK